MSLATPREYPQVNSVAALYSDQEDRVEGLNQRIFDRTSTDAPLAPNFSPRPTSTKYARFPVVDLRTPATVPIDRAPTFNPCQEFNPGNNRGPVSGFLSNINTESDIRFQPCVPIKANDVRVFVPSSESDLYKVVVPQTRPQTQPYPLLFLRDNQWANTTGSFCEENPQVGAQLLNNCTRWQLR
jgi:hypothetical protein